MALASERDESELNVRITGRHMDIGSAFRERIEDRLAEIVDKHFQENDNWTGNVTVEKSNGQFAAECIVTLGHGATFQAAGRAHDPIPCFEEAAERLEKRLRRHKRRLKEHRPSRKGPGPEAVEMAYAILTAPPEEDEEVSDDFVPTIVAESVRSPQSMTVSSAVLALDMGDAPVFVFRNAKDDAVNLVYRRGDGHIGWMDLSTAGSVR